MRRHVILAALAAALVACARSVPSPTGVPEAGALDVVLDTPNGDDGALLVRVSGGPIDSVTSPAGYAVVAGADEGGTHRIIVQGDVVRGVIARVWVSDASRAASYTAAVEQAASRGYAQRELAGYRASILVR
ncbi:MAG TPA: hypothetical protein VF041_13830 [Gemmatimonadaceae bacterium]